MCHPPPLNKLDRVGITGKGSDYSAQHSNELLDDDHKLNGRLVPYCKTISGLISKNAMLIDCSQWESSSLLIYNSSVSLH